MPPRISVIVPIYNAASTLRAAVQSILTQDIAGLEVLLVDDGSTDATPGLCHDLALRDDRIQVITQKNAGICAARNRGLSVAEGMYVTFCDDDDLLLPGALALLLQKAEDTGADIVRADYELIHISLDGTETPQPHPAGTAWLPKVLHCKNCSIVGASVSLTQLISSINKMPFCLPVRSIAAYTLAMISLIVYSVTLRVLPA